MNNCPNCGKGISTDRVVCECGELLRADATQHVHTWETETVFRPVVKPSGNRLASISVVLVVVASILALAWPQLRERWNTGDQAISKIDNSNAEPISTQSNLTMRSDLIESDPETDSVTQEGVFDFTTGERSQQNVRSNNAVRSVRETVIKQQTVNVAENEYDAHLLSDKAGTDQKQSDQKSPSDCKPETTASLKRPEPLTENETKPRSRSNSINYILGPRGGCFFVAAGGSKKYVDHSLCGAQNVAAARQD